MLGFIFKEFNLTHWELGYKFTTIWEPDCDLFINHYHYLHQISISHLPCKHCNETVIQITAHSHPPKNRFLSSSVCDSILRLCSNYVHRTFVLQPRLGLARQEVAHRHCHAHQVIRLLYRPT